MKCKRWYDNILGIYWQLYLFKHRIGYITCWCYDMVAIYSICTPLTHWGRVTHICVSKLTIIGSDNGLSPGRRQAIIWNNGGILSIGLLGTNFSEILVEILTFSFKKMRLNMSSAKWRLLRLGLNELNRLVDEFMSCDCDWYIQE